MRTGKQSCVYGAACCIAPLFQEALLYAAQTLSNVRTGKQRCVYGVAVTRTTQYCAAMSGICTLGCTNIVKTSETNVRPSKEKCAYGAACCIAPLFPEALLYAAQTLSNVRTNKQRCVYGVAVTLTTQYGAAMSGNCNLRCTNIVKTSETNVRPCKHNCVYGVAVLHERRSIAPLFPKTILYATKRT